MSSQQHPPLPPPDEQMLELERLLALAKVGTHELQSGETSPSGLRFPTSATMQSNDRFAQQLHDACERSMEQEEQADGKYVKETIDLDGDDDVVLVETCNSAPDDDEDEFDESVVVVKEGHNNNNSNGSENSSSTGILVEVPSDDDEEEKTTKPLSLYTTPASSTTPKFHFYSDEQRVPRQLNSIQLQSLRNRHAFQTRLHDVECKLALLTAQLADEEMALQRNLQTAVQDCVYQPLQQHNVNDSTSSTDMSLTQRWLTLEQRCAQLDARMTHGWHVQIPDLRRPSPPPNDTTNNTTIDPLAIISQHLHDAAVRADSNDSILARRWESLAGRMERRTLEETAARVAATTVLQDQLHTLVDPHRGQELLDMIRELRRTVEQEREERIHSDDQIREYIVKSTEAMKQAILGVYVDGDE